MRFGRETPKSFHPVQNRTLLAWSLLSVDAWERIENYVVMVPPGWEEKAEEEVRTQVPGLRCIFLAGGETRQESVAIGLKAVEGSDLVLVHDACRPIVSVHLIDRVVQVALQEGAAVPALEATDTLGRLRDENLEGIVPRERVVEIQTPQAFRFDILKKAFETADETIRTATDESSLVLAAGFPVRVVAGERWNIKVTVKEDLEIIGSFLEGKKLELDAAGGSPVS
jgi:2-C-methyl-D-erythritol 4-phosphate cytidylyltransferase